VKVLLDTHSIVWFMLHDQRLSVAASQVMCDLENECLISPVSHWELALKCSIGKYQLVGDFLSLWEDALRLFAELPISPNHSTQLIKLPFHHKDPFDRMLISQALSEQLPIISSDTAFDPYGIQRVW
jgi:PIN domain nuclease of toxin-antitoxin system